MLKVLKAKLYPNASQRRALIEYLDQARFVFNQCLEIRRDAWKKNKRRIGRFEQTKMLTAWRAEDVRLAGVPVEVTRDAIRRVDLAYEGFFRRIKNKKGKAGYPRFKAKTRYNSFSIGLRTNVFLGGRIRVSGIASPIRCRGIQEAEFVCKRLTVVRRGDQWFARILVDDGLEAPPLRPIRSAVGIDLGLNSFIATSSGETIECPKHYRRLERKLRKASRRIARCKRGSKRRKRAVVKLQMVHAKIADCRMDFTHKLSKRIINEYDLIAVEKLHVGGMVRSKLAKSILDAGWSQFTSQLAYKAERAGCVFVEVNPNGTSQICSQCGCEVPKDLSVRIHSCSCGLVIDRDVNAARNVLARGIQLSAPPSGSDGVTGVENCKTTSALLVACSLKRPALQFGHYRDETEDGGL